MKNNLVALVSVIAVLAAGLVPVVSAGNDPGATYADAFILLQEGVTAEQSSNWIEAFQKYNSAVEMLRAVRKDSPDWNPQVVEFRLKDLTDKLEAVR